MIEGARTNWQERKASSKARPKKTKKKRSLSALFPKFFQKGVWFLLADLPLAGTPASLNSKADYGKNMTSTDETTVAFIAEIGETCPAIWRLETIFYAFVMIAQVILDPDSGQSSLSQKPSCNFFGIKGTIMSKCNLPTWEDTVR